MEAEDFAFIGIMVGNIVELAVFLSCNFFSLHPWTRYRSLAPCPFSGCDF
jgi:hypothetical protein